MNGKSKSYEIISVDDHESLNRFYEKNDLEISEEDPVGTDAVKSWVLVEDEEFGGGGDAWLSGRENTSSTVSL